MIRTNLVTMLLTTVILTVATGFAQSSDRLPVTDADKIADSLRAGPAFITRNATVLDWPSASGAEYRVLRKGSNEWTCMPGIPGYPHDEPGCFDAVFLQWMKDTLAGRTPRIDRIGISYMYVGAWAKSGKGGEEFHVGPHLMIVSPHPDEFQGFNRDASNGMPYVTHLPNRTELFLVMPVRQWDEQHGHERTSTCCNKPVPQACKEGSLALTQVASRFISRDRACSLCFSGRSAPCALERIFDGRRGNRCFHGQYVCLWRSALQ